MLLRLRQVMERATPVTYNSAEVCVILTAETAIVVGPDGSPTLIRHYTIVPDNPADAALPSCLPLHYTTHTHTHKERGPRVLELLPLTVQILHYWNIAKRCVPSWLSINAYIASWDTSCLENFRILVSYFDSKYLYDFVSFPFYMKLCERKKGLAE